ncbi:FAD-binding oxidoreductase [Pseudonocardia oroxyli]|uniref:Glycolate oxidase FAD binding subunit n=1 Tax=Pseudonocardia oroxyli TaxID=366584 RepID=A0A1G7KMC7_PSEOR|nr:FAD-binding protein [Pseudonocardia oroxyli]SDF38408.1 glycolate oxidase FAD binding subunit [Pseudonocardia oroxyli]
MRTLVRPTSLAEARAALLDSAGPVAIAGAGTAATWAGALGPVETELSTTGLSGVLTHNPGDMTVSVRAGTPLRELQAAVREHGQHVSFDAARVEEGATVGGLLATGDAGPSALVHGSLRDLVIGTTTLLSDGAVVRSGGHVIKNVAGFDISKLLHGSYGTLGLLVEVVLRLHPVPAAVGTVAVECDLPEAARLAGELLASQLEPTAVEWLSSGRLLVRIDSTEEALPARLDRVVALVGGTPDPVSGDRRPGDDRRSRGWEEHAALTRGTPGEAVLRIGVKPSLLPGLLARLPVGTVTAGLGTGVATVSVPVGEVAAAHAAVHAAGGTSVLRTRPVSGTAVPAWGPPPSAVAVLRAVKQKFDPDSRFGPGRFDPWEIS